MSLKLETGKIERASLQVSLVLNDKKKVSKYFNIPSKNALFAIKYFFNFLNNKGSFTVYVFAYKS